MGYVCPTWTDGNDRVLVFRPLCVSSRAFFLGYPVSILTQSFGCMKRTYWMRAKSHPSPSFAIFLDHSFSLFFSLHVLSFIASYIDSVLSGSRRLLCFARQSTSRLVINCRASNACSAPYLLTGIRSCIRENRLHHIETIGVSLLVCTKHTRSRMLKTSRSMMRTMMIASAKSLSVSTSGRDHIFCRPPGVLGSSNLS
jgi:hypothetical protein